MLARNITTLNRLAAMSVGTGGGAIAGGVSVFNPVNLAMAATQYATGIALKYFPNNPGVRTMAEYLEKTAHAMGLLSRGPAVISSGSLIPIGLYGLRYLCQKGVDDYIKELLQYLPDTPRELAEPWALALNQIANAYAFKNIDAFMLSETGGNSSQICVTKENGHVCFASGSGYTPFTWTNHSMGAIASPPPELLNTQLNTSALMTPQSFNGFTQGTDDPYTHPENGDNAVLLNLSQKGNNMMGAVIKRHYKLARQHDVRDAPVRLPRYVNTPFSLKNTYPWIVKLEILSPVERQGNENYVQYHYTQCSGFLIDHMTILTAAHCMHELPGALTMTMQNLGNEGNEIYVHFENLDPTITIKASKFIIQPKYNSSLMTPDDIAVIHTEDLHSQFEEKNINIAIPSILELPITKENSSSIIRTMAGGYSQDSLQTPEMTWDISWWSELNWRNGYLVLLDPMSESGDSGGPLFGNGHGVQYITGVLSGRIQQIWVTAPILGKKYIYEHNSCIFSPTAHPPTLSFLKRHAKGARFIDQLPPPPVTTPAPEPKQVPVTTPAPEPKQVTDSDYPKNAAIGSAIGGSILLIPLIWLGVKGIKACKRSYNNNERLNRQLITNSCCDVFTRHCANPDHQQLHSPSAIVEIEMETTTERTEETPKTPGSTDFCGRSPEYRGKIVSFCE